MASTSEQWIHMVGIAGAGMSGLARVLSEQGLKITGSDLQADSVAAKFEQLGIAIYQGHCSSNLGEGVDLLVISSAIPQDNVEVKAAKEKNIPVLKRGQMLAKLVNTKKCIAVAGAHGKTTTTSMIYTTLADCGMDPSFIVGGELQGSKLNAKSGAGDFFVAEADESDASFLEIKPYIAVVTNIEDDHLDYYKSFENIKNAFEQFLKQVDPQGFAVLYGGDECNLQLKQKIPGRIILYGEKQSYDYSLREWKADGMGSIFKAYRQGEFLGDIELSVPGKHNAFNALAAIAVALESAANINDIKRALKKFSGARRRFQVIGSKAEITIVDDYAHHPTEIKATIAAARAFHKGRVIVVFQPHRYSRTSILGKQLGEAFINADKVIFTDVYSAGEQIIPGVSGETVYKAACAIGCKARYMPSLLEIENYLLEKSEKNDLIITMGAGDIWKLGQSVLNNINESVLR
ncbi:MAG: UDP-N-acetylmuramate--L-alanine ligase [Syntrophomonadaceae bacterium]|nr:UDP-N-acetylmuramate--L-alanine ligase [Syntrophomonadaceae bacterium]MDD3022426.1 UDP-N-acetylmuramate--L-alanine ligase [Syntrophomonadaceae bacterium]